MDTVVLVADYSDARQARDLACLLDCYARDVMGGGEPLSAYARKNLAAELAKIPHAFSVICYIDDRPAGLINCFEGFSTFQCKLLVNIHDIVVLEDYRGLGLSQLMLSRVEELAREKGSCKLTLEVLEGNEVARNAYIKHGFKPFVLDPAMGRALFWQKSL